MKNISTVLSLNSKKHPDKPYLICDDNTYSYSEIDILVDKTCSFLKEHDVSSGNVISLVLPNSVEYVLIYMAGLRLGCPVNPYPYTLTSKDISKYLGNVDPKVVFCKEKHYEEMNTYNNSKVVLVSRDFIEEIRNNQSFKKDNVDLEYDSPACIYYSSGTTGNPKSIVFSHRNMISNISSIVRGFNHRKEDTHLIILPLGHTASINYSFLPCTLIGATLVITESFWKIRSRFWEIIKEYSVNYVEVVPSVLVALLNTPYSEEQYSDITSLPYIGCGSATLPIEIQDSFYHKYGIKVANLYGLSETGPTHVDLPLEEGWNSGNIGRPLDVNEVRIVDANGDFLESEQEGEIVIKGDNVFIGYKNNDELYTRTVKNGFFHTGDLGYFDSNGIYYFTGRKKDLIIKGGINISPDEIDETIFKLAEVAETATVGIYDEYLGEKIVTYIVLKPDSELDSKKVKKFCQVNLSRDKVPDIINFVDSIPKGPSGKILRRKLRH